MCGIVGILGQKAVAGDLVDALRRLEYRGYDFGGRCHRRERPSRPPPRRGQAQEPGAAALQPPPAGTHRPRPYALGDARQARRAQCPPAHERSRRGRAQRHHRELPGAARGAHRQGPRASRPRPTPRRSLHLISDHLDRGLAPVEAAKAALQQLRGAFALAIIFAGQDNLMIGARQGPPLAIGHGQGTMYLGSDAIALAPFTDTITYLEDGDWAVLSREQAQIFNLDGRKVERQAIKSVAKLAAGRQGQLPPLHGQGDPRAARGDQPHPRQLHRFRRWQRAPAGPRHRSRQRVAGVDLRLRHRLLRRHRRQVLAGALCAHPRRDRRRLRVPLSRAAAPPRAGWRSSSRSRARPPTRWPALQARQGARLPGDGRLQRQDVVDPARVPSDAAHGRRTGDWRRVHQSLHVHDPRALLIRHRAGIETRSCEAGCGGAAFREAPESPGAHGSCDRLQARGRGSRRSLLRVHEFHFHGSRHASRSPSRAR